MPNWNSSTSISCCSVRTFSLIKKSPSFSSRLLFSSAYVNCCSLITPASRSRSPKRFLDAFIVAPPNMELLGFHLYRNSCQAEVFLLHMYYLFLHLEFLNWCFVHR